MSSQDFKITCPCCEARILVDAATGAVLGHEKPPEKLGSKSFEEAVSEDKKRRAQAEDRFSQAFREHQHRDQILEKKFREAFERADKEGKEPPPRPFDFD